MGNSKVGQIIPSGPSIGGFGGTVGSVSRPKAYSQKDAPGTQAYKEKRVKELEQEFGNDLAKIEQYIQGKIANNSTTDFDYAWLTEASDFIKRANNTSPVDTSIAPESSIQASQTAGANQTAMTEAFNRKNKGRKGTILTSALGLTDPATVAKKSLLGQ